MDAPDRRRSARRAAHRAGALLASLVIGAVAAGGGETATLKLSVRDAQDKPVAGARLKVERIDGNEKKEVESDSEGNAAAVLPLGTYQVTTRREGFNPDFVSGIILQLGRVKSVTIGLRPGDANEKLPHEMTEEERRKKLEPHAKPPPPPIDPTEAYKALGLTPTRLGAMARSATMEEARRALGRGDTKLAVKLAEDAVCAEGTLPTAWSDLGLIYISAGDKEKARIALELCVKGMGEDATAEQLGQLALVSGLIGKVDEAAEYYRRAEKLDPENAGRRAFELGAICHKHRKFREAVAAYEHAKELKCAEPLLTYYLGGAYLMAGDKAKSVAALKAFIEEQKALGEKADAKSVEDAKRRLGQLEGTGK